ncbi:MAG TPA: hypothetical protein VFP58_14230, partial [Candidatus Eisenbacteria bacterium]|nr:hypothetical protein [Candidatus Eisenbacteria bacterium]
MKQLVLMRIAPWPAGRMMAILYLVLGIVLTPIMLIYSLFSPEAGEHRALSLVMAIFMPVIYALIGFFSGLIGGALYNLFAKMFGGIPLEFEPAGAAAPL